MIRIDIFLFSNGHAKSREAARKSIEAGLVFVDGKQIIKPGEKIDESVEHTIEYKNAIPYVGRGGLKLEAALDAFSIDPANKKCIDIGASTGGFTDCLLQRGAAVVYAVDSGRDQLDPELRSDSRVISLEGVNARYLNSQIIPELMDIAVMDVSFISQTLILPSLSPLLTANGIAITLIKPQFECGREAIGKGGIVKKTEHRLGAVRRVAYAAEECGLHLIDIIRSPIFGGDGNMEFLGLFSKNSVSQIETVISKVNYNC
jgi:23S rRNA (cytidine1920-2'-O)/16S rRNA (cytidine1409-2'-O)-methyltransferase